VIAGNRDDALSVIAPKASPCWLDRPQRGSGKSGNENAPTKLLIFGNPKGGTPVMLAAPTVAIDLPLKILIGEDDQGKVWISYNSPVLFTGAASLAAGIAGNIAVVETLAAKAAE